MKQVLNPAKVLLVAVIFTAWVRAEEIKLPVKHDHFWGSCTGQLRFTDEGIRYETDEEKHARQWSYEDLQQVAIEPEKIVILTYRDRLLHLGQDERFTYDVVEGQVSDSLRVYLEGKVGRPLVSTVLPQEEPARYRLPVRHRKVFRGTEGVLELGEQYLIYRPKQAGEGRIWRYDEILSVGSTGPYQLRVTAMERTGGEYGSGKNFVFDLKQKLPEQAYDYLWNKINRPRIDGENPPAETAAGEFSFLNR
jgi:hypothetical protein